MPILEFFYFDLKDVDSTQLQLASGNYCRQNLIFIGKVCPSAGKRGFLQSVQTFLSAIGYLVLAPAATPRGGSCPGGLLVLPRVTPQDYGRLATGECASHKGNNPLGFARAGAGITGFLYYEHGFRAYW